MNTLNFSMIYIIRFMVFSCAEGNNELEQIYKV